MQAMFLSKYPLLTFTCAQRHLKYNDVDRLSSAFPLCMRLLHQALRTRHRLSHSARVSFTVRTRYEIQTFEIIRTYVAYTLNLGIAISFICLVFEVLTQVVISRMTE